MNVLHELIVVLLAWSLLAIGAALFGLYASNHPRWKPFWFMNGLWGWIDGAIILYALVTEPMTNETLKRVLWFNSGLDVCYVICGLSMLRMSSERWKGFGLAIAIQGLFLLTLDVTMAFRVVV